MVNLISIGRRFNPGSKDSFIEALCMIACNVWSFDAIIRITVVNIVLVE